MLRARAFIAAAVVSSVILGVPLLPPSGALGLKPAEAKDYYTRKRVNGKWITGRFPRRSAQQKAQPRVEEKAETVEKRKVGREQEGEVASRRAAPPAKALPVQPNPPSPDVQSTSALPVAPLNNDARMHQLQRALEAKAQAMAKTLAPPPAPIAAKSVTFDLEAGIKTIFLADGTVLEEPIDRSALASLGVAPPVPVTGPRTGGAAAPGKTAAR